MNWKAILAETLKKAGIIPDLFTGRITININQGAISDLERTERMK
jgi:hypothetical protein